MSKPQGEAPRGTFRVCIEINEVETEVISAANVAELTAKLAHFFTYYNLSDQFSGTNSSSSLFQCWSPPS